MGRVSCDVTMAQTGKPTPQNPLRVWPGVVAVVLQWLIWLVYPLVARGAIMVAMMGGLAGGLAVLVWWLFFSRAPWAERVGAIVLMVVAVVATKRVVHQSIAGAGMGMMLPIFAVPALSLALVTAAMASRRLSSGPRRASLVGAIVLACGVFTLLRTGGITGEGDSDFHWRWTPTPEQRLLAQAQAGTEKETESAAIPPAPAAAPVETPRPNPTNISDQPTAPATKSPEKSRADPAGAKTGADWSGFRGPERDGIIRGVRIDTNWSWTSDGLKPYFNDFVVHKGHAFGFDGRILACIDLKYGHGISARTTRSGA